MTKETITNLRVEHFGKAEAAQAAEREAQAVRAAQAARIARMRDAGPDLYGAARVVIEAWENGDLAAAVRELAAVVAEVK